MRRIINLFKFQNVNDFSHLPQASNFTYNYLLGIVMLYMMSQILSGTLIYKIVKISIFIAPASIFITPLIYCLSNVTTEVYGYQVGRNMMWWFIITSSVFTVMSTVLIHFPSPPEFAHQAAFNLIFGSMPRVYVAGILGTVYGLSFNNFLVSKLKIIMGGKHYWFRSLLSTCGGEIIYNSIAYPIMYIGVVPAEQLLHMYISVTLFKITTTIIFIFPECILANFLKFKEKINVFDRGIRYSIFKFKLVPLKSPVLTLIKNK